MKKDKKIYSVAELELIKKIESGEFQSLQKEDFEKKKIRFQKIAANTLKKK